MEDCGAKAGYAQLALFVIEAYCHRRRALQVALVRMHYLLAVAAEMASVRMLPHATIEDRDVLPCQVHLRFPGVWQDGIVATPFLGCKSSDCLLVLVGRNSQCSLRR